MARPNKSKRAEKPAEEQSGSKKDRTGKPAPPDREERPFRTGFLGGTREWTDAIIFAYVLAMFIRTFSVELYKIPTGSMTPTLVGGEVAKYDYDRDGKDDLLVYKPQFRKPEFQIWLAEDDEVFPWRLMPKSTRLPTRDLEKVLELKKTRYDRILVNKFGYWFRSPKRADLVVFKVPHQIWDRKKSIYIKRAVGLGGEKVAFKRVEGEEMDDRGRLTINGEPVSDPPIFGRLRYTWISSSRKWAINVPEGHIFVLGDNTDSSSDGRYWGTVPIENLKGKAFLRYWPLREFKFLN